MPEEIDDHATGGVKLSAEGWNDNHKKTYIMTSGKLEQSTEQAGVRRQDAHGNTYIRHHDRTVITQRYHTGSHSIDDHNKATQSLIGLEYAWSTDDCWKRCIACLLENIAADAFYAWRYVDPSRRSAGIKATVRDVLAVQLVNSRWLTEEDVGFADVPAISALDQIDSNSQCSLVKIPIPQGNKRNQQKCQMGCGHHTDWMCRKCHVYCCRPGTRDCFARHSSGEVKATKKRKRAAAAQGGRTNPTPFRMPVGGARSGPSGSASSRS